MFKLGKLDFEVKKATLRAGFMDADMSRRMGFDGESELRWFIGIDMLEREFITEISEEELADLEEEDEYIYESVSPRLYHNNGFKLNIKSWKDIAGITLNWDSLLNDDDEEAGYMYVFEHEDVTKGRIEFLRRKGDKFWIRWTGTANVYWDEEYGEDVPFSFEGEVTFGGIIARCDKVASLEELKAEISNVIDIEEFDCVSHNTFKFENGTSNEWNFLPKD